MSKNVTYIGIVVVVVIIIAAYAVLLSTPPASPPDAPDMSQTGIYRSLSTQEVSPGQSVTVTLDVVVVGDEDYYLIEEYVPSGWTAMVGEAVMDNRLTYYVLQNAESKSYTYTAVAPGTPGNYTFSGKYMFQGDEDELATMGPTLVVVA